MHTKCLVGKLKEKRPLGSPGLRQENKFNINIRDIGFDKVYWNQMAQDTIKWWSRVNTVMNLCDS